MMSKIRSTRFITINTRKCEACWECIDECKGNSLGKINLWFHKHVVIKNENDCCGCKKCIAVCPNDVFTAVKQKKVAV